jgi:hypothetical protein
MSIEKLFPLSENQFPDTDTLKVRIHFLQPGHTRACQRARWHSSR